MIAPRALWRFLSYVNWIKNIFLLFFNRNIIMKDPRFDDQCVLIQKSKVKIQDFLSQNKKNLQNQMPISFATMLVDELNSCGF